MSADGIPEIKANLDAWWRRMQGQAMAAADEIAHLLEAYSKTNAPFKDRTGNLRASIDGRAERVSDDLYRVILSAGMEYAIFVETLRNGKYAYLWPAILANQADIQRIWRERLSAA